MDNYEFSLLSPYGKMALTLEKAYEAGVINKEQFHYMTKLLDKSNIHRDGQYIAHIVGKFEGFPADIGPQ